MSHDLRAVLLRTAAVLALAAGAACAGPRPEKAAAAPAAAVDTGKIHAVYLDGDFDQAIVMIETWLRSKPRMSHSDSVFAFKHLGVMYAARNETREKGKYYMLKLLEVEPTARILDMYASDMIYMIFKNIREEFEANRSRLTRAQGHLEGSGQALPGTAPSPPARPPEAPPPPAAGESGRKSTAVYWVAGLGAAAAVAGGIAAYVMFSDEPGIKKERHEP